MLNNRLCCYPANICQQGIVMNYEEVLKFWFHELPPAQWWKKNPELDAAINKRFHDIYSVVIILIAVS